MVGSRKKKYGDFSNDVLCQAIEKVQKGTSIRQAATQFNIPKSTFHRKLQGLHMEPIGRPTCLSSEETTFVNHFIVVAEWGFPFSNLDLPIIVKAYLDKNNREVQQFKKNLTGQN